MSARSLEIRAAVPDDEPHVLALLREAMGWPAGGRDEALFAWKHRDNPFGPSPAWLAWDGETLAGYRTFMRWEFVDETGRIVSAVRAVDTVTAPAYRGRGVFRALTVRAIEQLAAEGVGLVFNTPNAQSRPGYLRMGWEQVGRLPVGVLPRGARGLARMLRSHAVADLWSEPTAAGLDARAALASDDLCEGLLRHAPHTGLRTRRSAAYLRWRTALEPLRYRMLLADPGDPEAGGLVVRLRRRGEARELVVAETLAPNGRTVRSLLRLALRGTGADYAIGLRTGALSALVPLPRQGPILTARPMRAAPPAAGSWTLTLGDVELF